MTRFFIPDPSNPNLAKVTPGKHLISFNDNQYQYGDQIYNQHGCSCSGCFLFHILLFQKDGLGTGIEVWTGRSKDCQGTTLFVDTTCPIVECDGTTSVESATIPLVLTDTGSWISLYTGTRIAACYIVLQTTSESYCLPSGYCAPLPFYIPGGGGGIGYLDDGPIPLRAGYTYATSNGWSSCPSPTAAIPVTVNLERLNTDLTDISQQNDISVCDDFDPHIPLVGDGLPSPSDAVGFFGKVVWDSTPTSTTAGVPFQISFHVSGVESRASYCSSNVWPAPQMQNLSLLGNPVPFSTVSTSITTCSYFTYSVQIDSPCVAKILATPLYTVWTIPSSPILVV